MRVLLVKTSSLGDLIHSFPALTDARQAIPGIRFDWLVEDAFLEVPSWHPAVDAVIPYALRRWRGGWLRAMRSGEAPRLWRRLRAGGWDLVIDAQGLLKSALAATSVPHVVKAGFDRHSAREPLASFCYCRGYAVPRALHAVERTRRLFALALGYPMPSTAPEFGLAVPGLGAARRGLVFLHATTWPSKHWPESYWVELLRLAASAGIEVALPWYSPEERLRAERWMRAAGWGTLLPRLGLTQLASRLAGAAGVVGVDSGLAHLAAALATPAVTLYGPTSAALTGALGPSQTNLSATFPCAPCQGRTCAYPGPRSLDPPCFEQIRPEIVWQQLQQQMSAPA